MNKDEWSKQSNRQYTYEYRYVHKLLGEWQQQNKITEICVVHHRDDTDETRKYNEEHYERWGLDENGDFVEGKYVIFMTLRDHASHHNKGKTLSAKTRRLIGLASAQRMTDEMRKKVSNVHKGKSISDEQKQKVFVKLKEHMQIMRDAYKKYKLDGGTLMWNDFRKQHKDTAVGDIQCN